MKEILTKKRKLKEHETIKLNEECSAILHNKLPPKLEDPWSFSMPCIIENFKSDNVLCDLGARINLMPLFVSGHWVYENQNRLLSHSNWQIDR